MVVAVLGAHCGPSPAGAMVSAKSRMTAMVLPSATRTRKIAFQHVEHAVRIARQGLRVVGAVESIVAGERGAEIGLHVRAREGEAAAAVVGEDQVAAAEEGFAQELMQGRELGRAARRSGTMSRTFPWMANMESVRE